MGDAVGGEPVAFEPDAHRVAALAPDDDARDPGQRLQPVLDIAIRVVGDLERAVSVAREGEPHDRLGVGLDFGDHRLVGLPRQDATGARDAVAHVRGGRIRVAFQLEGERDLAHLLDLMVSMPSIPASASSRGVVTWLSMTSLDAPR